MTVTTMKYKKILSLLVLLVTTATGYAQSAITLSANSDGTWSAPAYTSVIPLRMEVEYEQDPAQIYNLTDNGNGTWSIGSIPKCSKAIMVVEYIEAYACYTSSDHTLTFYCDNQRESRGGTIYHLNTDEDNTGWEDDGTNSSVTKVVFNSSFADARPTTTYCWFYNMTNLESIIGMNYLNTSEVKNMAGMFYGCSRLNTLNLSNLNTSKVTFMASMFSGCSNLQTIYVGSGWSTAKVVGTNSSLEMFKGCTSLKGGQSTTYNANHVDKTYARIDGGSSNPGYFTYKKPSGIATDLHQVTSDKSQVTSDEWYTIDGRKLNGMPAKKGVYIQNGQKRIIK